MKSLKKRNNKIEQEIYKTKEIYNTIELTKIIHLNCFQNIIKV